MTTEILTESFCERCGTRYEFGTPEPLSTGRKTRGLVTGLRDFIMSTDTLSDSINDAMRAEEETLAAVQIEAFQQAFNFCLDCRRYTCVNCWNDDAGRCRSCVPLVGVDDIAGFDQRVVAPPVIAAAVESPAMLTSADTLTWPESDSIAPAAAATDDELAEVEPAAAEAVEEVIPEPVVEAPEPVAAEEPEPVAAQEPEPEVPVAPPPPVTTPRRDLRETFLRGPIQTPVAASKAEVPESLAARRSQLDSLGIDDPGEGTVSVGQRTELPYRSSGAGSSAGGSAALAAVWDASTRALMEGAKRAALMPCGSCGLTVSSTARFCRRCGTPQTLSA
ncbi:MAG TPA: hypothetical protein VMK30_03200 [Pleomorphomonadaceae bacterium]|nr:hypothetical protein [Pleomorphomonadaceae bacterium]